MNKQPKIRKDREYRRFFDFELRALADTETEENVIEGYAAVFDSTTVLWEYEGVEYKEKIAPGAFDSADMTDVIFNYNHNGKVVARTRNRTLQLSVDSKGLKVKADLSGTEEGRKLYDEIKGGYIDRMSYAYVVQEDSYDRENHTRTIRGIKKVYDVSAVDIPAYEDAVVEARSLFEAKEQEQQREKRCRELMAQTII